MEVFGSTRVALVYSNPDKNTNGGVNSLTVGMICDKNANDTVLSDMKTLDGGATYAATLTS